MLTDLRDSGWLARRVFAVAVLAGAFGPPLGDVALVQASASGAVGAAVAEDDADKPDKPDEDKWVEGKFYLRLMTGTPEDCRKLGDFLADRGVATQLVIMDNVGLGVVYALDRAYAADELDSESAKRYREVMRTHGKAWKEHNGGRGSDLSSMYYSKYVKVTEDDPLPEIKPEKSTD